MVRSQPVCCCSVSNPQTAQHGEACQPGLHTLSRALVKRARGRRGGMASICALKYSDAYRPAIRDCQLQVNSCSSQGWVQLSYQVAGRVQLAVWLSASLRSQHSGWVLPPDSCCLHARCFRATGVSARLQAAGQALLAPLRVPMERSRERWPVLMRALTIGTRALRMNCVEAARLATTWFFFSRLVIWRSSCPISRFSLLQQCTRGGVNELSTDHLQHGRGSQELLSAAALQALLAGVRD